jgi:hypothetical protein
MPIPPGCPLPRLCGVIGTTRGPGAGLVAFKLQLRGQRQRARAATKAATAADTSKADAAFQRKLGGGASGARPGGGGGAGSSPAAPGPCSGVHCRLLSKSNQTFPAVDIRRHAAIELV